VATPSRTSTKPLSPRLLADRVVPLTTSTHAVEEPEAQKQQQQRRQNAMGSG
jgi:hypothetical protein